MPSKFLILQNATLNIFRNVNEDMSYNLARLFKYKDDNMYTTCGTKSFLSIRFRKLSFWVILQSWVVWTNINIFCLLHVRGKCIYWTHLSTVCCYFTQGLNVFYTRNCNMRVHAYKNDKSNMTNHIIYRST